ncbi:MAG: mechanosensitive ion channel family protein [Elusimicrobiota bacterium]|nr:mechanosensitive ion channel family protein [Elusimicrobiota bacterium]
MIENYLISYGTPVNLATGLDLTVRMISLILACFIVNIGSKKYLIKLAHMAVYRSKVKWDDELVKQKFFRKASYFIPALLIYLFAPWALADFPHAAMLLQRATNAYMIIVAMISIDALLKTIIKVYQDFPAAQKHPIGGYIQAVEIIMFFLGGIFILAMALGKSPWGLLSLLGGLTAVLILVFKDVLLGFVASIQLSFNDMVVIGDWIEMPKYGADGDVIEINLTTVKVSNWDKTITTIPIYALISDSFKNWRGMSESGGRRIKRPIFIDMNTIKFCDDAMLDHFRKFQHLREYLDKKISEVEEYNKKFKFDTTKLINGRRLTNLGTFRAYIVEYLKRHPKIHQEMTFLIRHLAPTSNGLPIEIYVFCNDQVWPNYEAIQADIFDHILAVVPEFELRIFQNPSGSDFSKFVSTK